MQSSSLADSAQALPHASTHPNATDPSAPKVRPTWIALTGPTASGKSSIAMRLAQDVPLEIISVDSALVYVGMDIGTAKPSVADRAAVPHHLIDIRDPLDAYSAAAFVHDTEALVRDITARGKLPLLVGGTMLYLRALTRGLDAMPQADPALRQHIEAEAKRRGWPAMHAELMLVDPTSATRLAPMDSQRIQRALEVWHLTGRTLSSWHTQHPEADGEANASSESATAAPRVTINPASAASSGLLISLEPSDRAWLHSRIAERFDAMLAGGLVDEVRTLMARGDLDPDLPSMRCVGYRQTWNAIDDGEVYGREYGYLRDQGIAATRQLAKRQLTWLRSMATRHVVACDQPTDAVYSQVLQRVRDAWPVNT
jgi:tRNA dimethylallyltransferase